MWIKQAALCIIGGSFGLFVSGAVFTTLTAVGIVPRFAGKTHTADRVFLYEEMVVFGMLTGNVVSVFYGQICRLLENIRVSIAWLEKGFLGFSGLFIGIFVGCLALAIAEMIDTIPIFARRTKLQLGMKQIVLSIAFGKLMGSLFFAKFL